MMRSIQVVALGILSANALQRSGVDIDIVDGMPLEQEDLFDNLLVDDLVHDRKYAAKPDEPAELTQETFDKARKDQDNTALEAFVRQLIERQGQRVTDESQFKDAMSQIKDHFTVLKSLRKALKQAGPHFGIHETAGHTAALNADGYKQVIAGKSASELKIFARRLAFSINMQINVDAINTLVRTMKPLKKDVSFEDFKSSVAKGASEIKDAHTLARARRLSREAAETETAQDQMKQAAMVSNILSATSSEQAFSILSEVKSEAGLRAFLGLHMQKQKLRLKADQVPSYTDFVKSVTSKLGTLTYDDLISQLNAATFVAKVE